MNELKVKRVCKWVLKGKRSQLDIFRKLFGPVCFVFKHIGSHKMLKYIIAFFKYIALRLGAPISEKRFHADNIRLETGFDLVWPDISSLETVFT